jgi:phage protein U
MVDDTEKDNTVLKYFVSPIISAILVVVLDYYFDSAQAKQQEIWLQKKETFEQAITLVAQRWDSSKFNGPGSERHKVSGNIPTTMEKNSVLAGLYVFAENKDIPNGFLRLADGEATPASIGEFIKTVRAELGLSELEIPPERMAVFYSLDTDIQE